VGRRKEASYRFVIDKGGLYSIDLTGMGDDDADEAQAE
jgi:hypothetical protein